LTGRGSAGVSPAGVRRAKTATGRPDARDVAHLRRAGTPALHETPPLGIAGVSPAGSTGEPENDGPSRRAAAAVVRRAGTPALHTAKIPVDGKIAAICDPRRDLRYVRSMGAHIPPDHPSLSCRGYLPHFHRPGLIQSITFRLCDAIPTEVLERWRQELDANPTSNRAIVLRKRVARHEDAGHGACWLAQSDVAAAACRCLREGIPRRYDLLAWCIMPNHVHAIVRPASSIAVRDIVQAWKSTIAHAANRILGRKGRFWAPDYFDRYIRDERHLDNAIAYIENNPAAAGLVAAPSAWPYSSAGWNAESDCSREI